MPTSLPPLTEPGAELTPAQQLRYSRHLLLPAVGDLGQRRLLASRVLVVGAGGLGSPILLYLAAAGVGTIGIIDPDLVEVSNLHRQILHGSADVGRPKTTSAAESVGAVNPDVTVVEHQERLTAANAERICAGYDLVLDGTDNFPTRYLVNDVCALLGLPLVWGSILGFEGQASVFWAAHGPQYRDVFPTPPPPGSVPSCATGGVLGVLCGVIGSIMATEAVKLICGAGDTLLGRILFYDALALTFRTISVRPDPDALPITGLVDYEAFCGVLPPAGLVGATELASLVADGTPVLLVDVREPWEHARGAIEGSVLIPLDGITSAGALELIGGHPEVILYCASGARSARAVDELRAAGLTGVRQLDGGILAWQELAARGGR
ncbi:adenylyltransferase/sulfurtransferase MoeZ [Nakamurella silvestris]|nr:adenylyltransferase/sulfurtransferase MoeZ [Nakamurella silvestris]